MTSRRNSFKNQLKKIRKSTEELDKDFWIILAFTWLFMIIFVVTIVFVIEHFSNKRIPCSKFIKLSGVKCINILKNKGKREKNR